MPGAIRRAFFDTLSRSASAERALSRFGLAKPGRLARRFVAGESVSEAVGAARALKARGMAVTFRPIGRAAASLEEADAAARRHEDAIRRIAESGIEPNISVELPQLGLGLDRAVCIDNLRRVLGRTSPKGLFLWIDREGSGSSDDTFRIVSTLLEQGHRNLGVTLQAVLFRSEDDLERMIDLGVRVRLVAGSRVEAKAVAHRRKSDVEAAGVRMMERALSAGAAPALATHDPATIERAKRYARGHGIRADQFEFQMYYGAGRDLQAALAAEGWRVRVYIPFGETWFPYCMRRLAQRPVRLRDIAG